MFLIFRSSAAIADSATPFTRDELRHIRVRRMRPGDEILIGDGISRRWSGVLSDDGKSAQSISPNFVESIEPRRILFTALPSPKRWDWLLQKSAELGVSEVYPVIFERSEKKKVSLERGQRILEEAAVQSGRFFLPLLRPELTFLQMLDRLRENEEAFAMSPRAELSLLDEIKKYSARAFLIIGPEGGYARAEEQLLLENKIPSFRIGRSVLRVETACLAALSLLS